MSLYVSLKDHTRLQEEQLNLPVVTLKSTAKLFPSLSVSKSALTKLLQITQAGYNAITPASDTLYIIVG